MFRKLITSFAVGQGLFWTFGYDQLGLFMNPKKQFGLGQKLARSVAKYLPATPRVTWLVKLVEIATDFGKMPLEGEVYKRYGICPDVVACAATQPLWSLAEGIEKSLGVVLHPERVNTKQQLEVSLACIYGSIFRYGQAAALLYVGDWLDKRQRATTSLTN